MLTKLDSKQIATFWDDIKKHLEIGLLPYVDVTPEGMLYIQESLLKDVMQAWVSYEGDAENIDVKAIVTTTVTIDPASQSRSLIIYSLSGYDNISKELYLEGMEGLKQYALSRKCTSVVAYTSIPNVEKLAVRLGATRTALLVWRL